MYAKCFNVCETFTRGVDEGVGREGVGITRLSIL